MTSFKYMIDYNLKRKMLIFPSLQLLKFFKYILYFNIFLIKNKINSILQILYLNKISIFKKKSNFQI